MTQGIFPPPTANPYASGMDVLATIQMTSTTNTISNIPQTYKSLYLVLSNLTQSSNATTNTVTVGTNSVDNGASTIGATTYFYPTSATATGWASTGLTGTSGGQIQTGPVGISSTNHSYLEIFFPQYTVTTQDRHFAKGFSNRAATNTGRYFDAYWNNTGPITAITIYSSFAFATGTATLYGLK